VVEDEHDPSGIVERHAHAFEGLDREWRGDVVGECAVDGGDDGVARDDAPAFEVDVDDLHPQLLAGGNDLLGRLHVVRGHLGDVHEAFDALAHLYERPERHEFGDPPVHQLANLMAGSEFLPRILLRRLERE